MFRFENKAIDNLYESWPKINTDMLVTQWKSNAINDVYVTKSVMLLNCAFEKAMNAIEYHQLLDDNSSNLNESNAIHISWTDFLWLYNHIIGFGLLNNISPDHRLLRPFSLHCLMSITLISPCHGTFSSSSPYFLISLGVLILKFNLCVCTYLN